MTTVPEGKPGKKQAQLVRSGQSYYVYNESDRRLSPIMIIEEHDLSSIQTSKSGAKAIKKTTATSTRRVKQKSRKTAKAKTVIVAGHTRKWPKKTSKK